MEAYTWPDGETGYTNGTINLSYSPETPGAILIELTQRIKKFPSFSCGEGLIYPLLILNILLNRMEWDTSCSGDKIRINLPRRDTTLSQENSSRRTREDPPLIFLTSLWIPNYGPTFLFKTSINTRNTHQLDYHNTHAVH